MSTQSPDSTPQKIPKHLKSSKDGVTGRGMMFSDTHGHAEPSFTPRYLTIANDISKRIFDGEYRPGEKLPPMRTLAKRYGVSTQVIFSALQGLQAIRYVEKRKNTNGVFVSPDLSPKKFYRIAVFLINQNPLSYSAVLFPMYKELDKRGYTMILGMNFDNGLTLRQWFKHKRNMDCLIVVGTPQTKDLDQFEKINVPYIFLASPAMDDIYGFVPKQEMELFIQWLIGTYISRKQPEERPIYLFGHNPLLPALPLPEEWTKYDPKHVYSLQQTDTGLAVAETKLETNNPSNNEKTTK